MPLIQGDAKDKLQSVIGYVFQHQGAFRVFAMRLAWQARGMLMAVSSVKKDAFLAVVWTAALLKT